MKQPPRRELVVDGDARPGLVGLEDLDAVPLPTDDDAPVAIDDLDARPRRAAKKRATNGKPSTTKIEVIDASASPDERPCTDLGNAERLADRHGENLRWCEALGLLAFATTSWRRDDTREVVRRAEETVRSIIDEARVCGDKERRNELLQWARKSEAANRLDAMVRLACADARIVTTVDAFDRDPFAFNCPNGTVDLQTGKLRPHRRDDLITKCSPVAYDPDAKAPTFDRFMRSVFEDPDVAAFAMRWLGYALTGDVSEQAMVVAHGKGANGKSTLLDIVAEVMGDYHSSAPPHLLVARSHEAHPTERTVLHGARLVTSIEIGEGRRWDEELVKLLTGGDRITARRMRRDFYTFAPTHKLTVACNHLPVVRGNDHAIWRRLLVLPFTRTFNGDERDPAMAAKLRAELPGILAALVRGCLAWRERGLSPPDAVRVATEGYRGEQDQVGRFIDEQCVVGDQYQVRSRPLFEAYRAWCERSGERSVTETAFGKSLTERGFEVRRAAVGKARFGIGLVENEPAEGGVYGRA